jgi:hypothetical protein
VYFNNRSSSIYQIPRSPILGAFAILISARCVLVRTEVCGNALAGHEFGHTQKSLVDRDASRDVVHADRSEPAKAQQ